MSQRKLILLITAVLLVAIGSFGVYRNNLNTPKPTAANAAVATGLSLRFNRPLPSEAKVVITDSENQLIASRTLEANAQQFNFNLVPGVYSVSVQQTNLPATAPMTFTVTDGRLSQVILTVPNDEE